MLIMLLLSACSAQAQTTVTWRDSASNGNWEWGANHPWWYPNWGSGGESHSRPDAFDGGNGHFVSFDNNHQRTMSLNAGWFNVNELYFTSNADETRTISDNGIDLRGGKIENQSSVNHIFNSQLSLHNTAQLNPVNGNLTFNGRIYMRNHWINVYGNNGHFIHFYGVLDRDGGNGGLAIKENSYAVLTENNTMSGGMWIERGGVRLGNDGSGHTNSAGSGTINVGTNAVLELHASQVWRPNELRLYGRGVTDANGAFRKHSGSGSGTATWPGNVVLYQHANIRSDSGTLRISGTISQNGANRQLVIRGPDGTVEMTANNTYSGGTYIDEGILSLAGHGIPGSGRIDIGSGLLPAQSAELMLNASSGGISLTNSMYVQEKSGAASRTLASMNTSGENIVRGTITLEDNSQLRLFMPSGSGLLSITNIVSGSESIWVDAAGGIVALSGPNTYSGGTFLDRGSLRLTGRNNAAGPGRIYVSGDVANAGNATLLIEGGRTIANELIARPMNLDTTARIEKESNGDTEMTGRLHLWANDQGGQRQTRIVNTGTGTFTFSGDINLADPQGDNRALFIENAVMFSGAITNGGTRGLVIRGPAGAPTFDGTVQVHIFQDAGNATIGPNAVFEEGTIYQLGTSDNLSEITEDATLTFGTGDRAYEMDIKAGFFDDGDTPGIRQFNFTHGSDLITLDGTVEIGVGTENRGYYLRLNNTEDVLIEGNLTGVGGIHKIGPGLMTLAGAASYESETLIENGALRLGSSTAVGDAEIVLGYPTTANDVFLFVANGATLETPVDVRSGTGDRTIGMNESSGTAVLDAPITLGNHLIFDVPGSATLVSEDEISGAHSIEKIGTGWLAFRGANTYSGLTEVREGALSIEHANALGGTGSGTDVSDGAALEIRGGITTAAEPLTLRGAGRTLSPGGVFRNVADDNTFSGPITMALSSSFGVDDADDTLTLGGVVGGTAARNLSKVGPGTLALTANNTFLGEVRIEEGAVSVASINSTASAAQPLGQRTSSPVIRFIDTDTIGTLRYTGDADAELTKGVGLGVGSTPAYGAIEVTEAARTLTITEPVVSIGNVNGRLYKTGPGRLTLDAVNTYQGRTMIQQGPLRATRPESLGTTTDTDNHATFVEPGGALEVIGGIALAERMYLEGTGVSGGGALRNISGDNTMSGRFYLTDAARINSDAGTLTLNNGTAISGAFGLTLGGAGNIDVASVIGTGTGTLTKDGSGTARLLANNTYTGNTTVEAGTLQIGAGTAGSVSSSSDLHINAGATSVVSRSDAWTYSGSISGAGQLRKREAGTITLSGDSPTFSGGVWHEPNSGLLNIGHANALGTGPYTIQGEVNSFDNVTGDPLAVAAQLVLFGSPTFMGSDNLTFGGSVTITGANRSITVSTNVLILNGSIGQDVAGRVLTKLGHDGWLTLNGNNTHSGGTRVDQGRLNLGHVNALGSGPLSVAGAEFDNTSGGTMSIANQFRFNGTPRYVGTDDLTITGAATLGEVDRQMQVLAGNLTLAGVLSQESGARRLTKYGDGTLTLEGHNTHGGTTLGGGGLHIGHRNALGSGTFVVLQASGGVTFDNTTGGNLVDPVAVQNPVEFGGNATFAGTHALEFDNAFTLTADRTLTIPNASLTLSGVLGQSGGDRSLTKAGEGRLILRNQDNTFADTLTIAEGFVRIFGTNSLGTVDGGTVVQDGATLELADAVRTDVEPLSLAGMGVAGGGALRSVEAGAYYNGPITLAAHSRINSDAGELRVRGGVAGEDRDLFVGGAGSVRFDTVGISGANTRLIVDASGSVQLYVNSTFGGGIIASNGTLVVEPGDLRLGSVPAAFEPDHLTFNGATFRMLNTLVPHVNRGVTIGPNGMTVSTPGVATLPMVITGSGNFTKVDNGTLTMSGMNTYTGDSAVNAGTVVMSGSAVDSDFTIASGATLRGAGAVGDLTVMGIVNPGNNVNGVGELNVDDLNLEENGEMVVDFNEFNGVAGTGWDLITASGDVTINSTPADRFTIRLRGNPADFEPWSPYTNVIISGASVAGFDVNNFTVDWSEFTAPLYGGTFEIAQIDDDIVIINNPVPFPAATDAVFGVMNVVTDAQLRNGNFDVTMYFFSSVGMDETADLPSFGIMNPDGVLILEDHVFSSLTYADEGREQIASNAGSHPGSAYVDTMLGIHTGRYSAVSSNGVIRQNVEFLSDGTPIAFEVVDDDTEPPVFSGFNIDGGIFSRFADLELSGQVQDIGSGIIADPANTNRPHFRLYGPDGSVVVNTTYFTNSVSADGEAQAAPATLTYTIDISAFCAGEYTLRVIAVDADNDRPNDEERAEEDFVFTIIAPYSLPFTETFEDDGTHAGALGPVHCQRGWVSGTNAVVQDEIRYEGAQALRLQNDTASHSFTGDYPTVTFSFMGILLPEDDDDVEIADGSALFWVNPNHTITVYDGAVKTPLAVGVNPAEWNHYVVNLDYMTETWTIAVNGTNLIQTFDFRSSPASDLITLSFVERTTNEVQYSYIDNINIQEERYTDPGVTNHVAGIANEVTDAQMVSGDWSLVIDFWSGDGMAVTGGYPNYDLLHPDGTVILTNQTFDTHTLYDSNRGLLASNSTHISFINPTLGVYTARWSAITANGMIMNGSEVWSNGTTLAFTVIDDDTEGPVHSGFTIDGSSHEMEFIGDGLVLTGLVQDVGSGVIFDDSIIDATNRPHFRVYKPDGSLAMDTTFFTNNIAAMAQSSSERILIDFGQAAHTTPGNWNNMTATGAGTTLNDLINDDGDATDLTLRISTSGFSGATPEGTTGPDPSLGYPASATRDSFWGGANESVLVLSNLNQSATYTFTFFSSRLTAGTRITDHVVEGATTETVSLDATDNTDTVVTTGPIAPRADGSIQIAVRRPGASGFYYLGIMDITIDVPGNAAQTEAAGLSHFIPESVLDQWGEYEIHVTSTDADNDRDDDQERTTDIFTFTIVREEYRIFVDIGAIDHQTTPNWNNLIRALDGGQNTAGGLMPNLIASDGEITAIDLHIVQPFHINANYAGTTTPYVDLVYPASATRDNLFGADPSWESTTAQEVILVLSNLHAGAAAHIVRLFASAGNDAYNREAEYTISGSVTNVLYLNATGNQSNRLVSTPMWPREDGTIEIRIVKGPGNTHPDGIFYLGVLDLQVTRDVVAIAAAFGEDNVVTDAQMRSGEFVVAVDLWSNVGMAQDGSAPRFDLFNPLGVEILTNQLFAYRSNFQEEGRLLLASNLVHAGVAYDDNMLGVYTARVSAANTSGRGVQNMPWLNALYPPAMTFTVIDDDVDPPVIGETPLALMIGEDPVPPVTNTWLVAGWNFNDADDRTGVSHGEGTLANNLNPAFSFESGAAAATDLNAVSGDEAGFGARVTGTGNNNRYIQFELDLSIYEDLVMTFAARRSDTGHNNNTISYSINGGDFVVFQDGWNPTLNAWALETLDFSTVTAMNGAESVVIRITFNGASHVAGVNRFDNFQFNAQKTSYFEITDAQLGEIDANNPLRFAFNVYDVGSGIVRGTTENGLNMRVSIDGIWSDNISSFRSDMSSADTTIATSTSVWEWATSFSYEQIGEIYGDGISNRPIRATVADADNDRPNDASWMSNRTFGIWRIIDDDDDPPEIRDIRPGLPGGSGAGTAISRPFVVMTGGVYRLSTDQDPEVRRARREGTGVETEWVVSDKELANAGDRGIAFAFGAWDEYSGVARGSAGDTNTVMSFSLGNVYVGDFVHFDVSASTPGNPTNAVLTNIWSFTDTTWSGEQIHALVEAGATPVRVTIPDLDDDRPNDAAILFSELAGYLRVVDDDVDPPLMGALALQDGPEHNLFVMNFDEFHGWTNVGTVAQSTVYQTRQNWVGEDYWLGTAFAVPVNPATSPLGMVMSGRSAGAFQTGQSAGRLQMPEREDLGTLFLWGILSGEGTRSLVVEGSTNDAASWDYNFGTNAVTATSDYELLTWDIDHPGPMILRLRPDDTNARTVYFDDLSLVRRTPWTNVLDLAVSFDNAEDKSGIYQYRALAGVSPVFQRGTNIAQGTLLATNVASFAVPEGVVTGFVFAVDNDNDRPHDRIRNAGIPYVARIDRTPPIAVTGLDATRADLAEYLGYNIDESSEIAIKWNPFSSEAVAAGPRESDNAALSPWDTYLITYYEVDANEVPISGGLSNTISWQTAEWAEGLREWNATNIILSDVAFDTYYRIGVQGRDAAGNVGPIQWTLGSTDRFIITQGLASAHAASDIFWQAAPQREYDLLHADDANFGEHMNQSHRWHLIDSVATNWARDTNQLAVGNMRFYRAAPKGRWQNPVRPVASEEVYVAIDIRVRRGLNWVALPGVPDQLTVGRVFGDGFGLPAGSESAEATRITWYHRATNEQERTHIWLANQEPWWRSGNESAMEMEVNLADGVVIEIPTNMPLPEYTFRYVARVPSPDEHSHAQVQTIMPNQANNLVSIRLPRQMHPRDMNLVITNSSGERIYGMAAGLGVNSQYNAAIRADGLWAWNRHLQRSTGSMYFYDGSLPSYPHPGWHYPTGAANSGNRVTGTPFGPDDGIVLRSFASTESWEWTNRIPYSAPTRFLSQPGGGP